MHTLCCSRLSPEKIKVLLAPPAAKPGFTLLQPEHLSAQAAQQIPLKSWKLATDCYGSLLGLLVQMSNSA